ncbi:hypothetical protein D9756_005779 [Leucocoprinus leucothites]|uniref:Glycan binding protein Y3-like domain-containing protein n=1 Tax=Leucocoprinus leucothites TaxID=201217 RepID=A0A8H5D9F5_9AGAR|nr:hypothetical protein D9756_005779 [Leucoagaricus leucothites]
MLSKTVFMATILAAAMAQGPRTCFQGNNGVGAAPATDCAQFITGFCSDAAASQIPVRVNDSTSRCFNLPDGDRCDLTAFNTYSRDSAPSGTNCVTVMTDLAANCNLGGFGKINNSTVYTFTIDRNHGVCKQGVQAGS